MQQFHDIGMLFVMGYDRRQGRAAAGAGAAAFSGSYDQVISPYCQGGGIPLGGNEPTRAARRRMIMEGDVKHRYGVQAGIRHEERFAVPALRQRAGETAPELLIG